MTRVVAESEFIAEDSDGARFAVHVSIGIPVQAPSGEWICSLGLKGLQDDLIPMRGEDAVQALCLTLGLAASLLRAFVQSGGTLHFADGSHDAVPLDSYFGPFATSGSPPAA